MKFNQWEIWKANLDPVIGSEQGKTRPVVIISDTAINKILNIVNVLPITSLKKGRTIYPNETFIKSQISGLELDSIVLCYQIRTLDKSRLIKFYGSIYDINKRKEIIEALSFQFGFDL
jgi:mRNA interferase MazF